MTGDPDNENLNNDNPSDTSRDGLASDLSAKQLDEGAEYNARADNDPSPGSPNPKRLVVRIAKALIAILVCIGLVWATKSALQQWQTHTQKLQDQIKSIDGELATETDPNKISELEGQRDQLQDNLPTLGNLKWGRLGLSAVLYAIGIFIPGFVLHAALHSLGERPKIKTAIASQLLGHAGKYVPGKAMVIVLRVGGLSIDKVKTVQATISVFMETLLMMAVGAAVACIVIFWLPVPVWMKWSAVGVAIGASIPTAPPILKYVAARVSKNDQSVVSNSYNGQKQSSLKFFVVGWAWSLVSWVLIGASFTMLVASIPSVSGDLPNLAILSAVSTAAIALAVVVGFVSLLPGGAGIRELVLTTILATSIDSAHALLAALAARLMFIIIEGICAGGAWIWLSNYRAATGDSLEECSDQ